MYHLKNKLTKIEKEVHQPGKPGVFLRQLPDRHCTDPG
jgi:hypothetical protein